MRIMALDYGSKTVGVAVSDPLMITSQDIESIRRKQENKLRRTLARIEELIVEYDVTDIVIGLPLNMDGSEGERARLSREFASMVERRTGITPVMVDERLTTVSADMLMDEAGLSPEKKKEHVDAIAAGYILDDYMAGLKNKTTG